MKVENDLIPATTFDYAISSYFVTGTGNIHIFNTGGASSSEGGMGSGNDNDTSKGDLSKPGERTGNSPVDKDTEEGFDPIGKNIKENEKEAGD